MYATQVQEEAERVTFFKPPCILLQVTETGCKDLREFFKRVFTLTSGYILKHSVSRQLHGISISKEIS